ncbi:MAG: hypothetical protein V1875_05665 [Candidatus Altiarchaeota archaeon]
MDSRTAITLILAIFAASQADAAIDVSLSADPVNCKDPFTITAVFHTGTGNSQVEFFVDDVGLEVKNINGETESKTTFSGESMWARLPPGNHKANVKLISHESLVDEGSLDFEVAGRRCPPTTTTTLAPTTTTTLRFYCSSNLDCAEPVTAPPECDGQNITQALTWGECRNANTPDAKCVDRLEIAYLRTCAENETCTGGECIAIPETTTTLEPTTSTNQELGTTSTIGSTTTTDGKEPATTSTTTDTTSPTLADTTTTQPPIFGRTNTRLDALMDIFEAMIRLILFWR